MLFVLNSDWLVHPGPSLVSKGAYQEEKLAALSPLREVCLLQYGMHLGDFQQDILTLLWDFHVNSTMQWRWAEE